MKSTQLKKNNVRFKRKMRVRKKVRGIPLKPRLSVFRSRTQVYAQLIDDLSGTTLASASSIDRALKEQMMGKGKKEKALLVGSEIARKAKELSVEQARFDRGPYKFHGIVASIAQGARDAGLKF